VLAVLLFVLLWVLLALSLVFVAIRGGIGGARAALQTQARGARRPIGVLFAIIYVGFGVAIPLLLITGNHGHSGKQVGGYKLTSAERTGRELFGQNCAVCHTLAAANATGKTGPNLDQLQPTSTLVVNTINNGCLQNAPTSSPQSCLGYGTMPSDIVEGKQAQEVAEFVARVAGKE
jgi:mono/diheme cytochrome c family protein